VPLLVPYVVVMFFSGLIVHWRSQNQHPDMPVLEHTLEEILALEDSRPDASSDARRVALEIYVAGPLREVAVDSTMMLAGTNIDPLASDERELVRRILADHPEAPAESVVAEARGELAGFLAEQEREAKAQTLDLGALVRLGGGLLHLIAPLAVVLGVLFRGGPSMRGFGIAVVNDAGAQASWPRVVVRSLVTWLPFLVLWLPWLRHAESPVARGVALAVFLIGVVVAVANPGRGVQDRVAGTWLVPR
jgi:hypothetical protein